MAAIALALALLAAGPSGPPSALTPSGVTAAGLYVTNLDAERDWFVGKLGAKVARQYPANTDKPSEWILSVGDGQANIVLTRSTTRPAGPNGFSRIVLKVPDPKGLAEWLKTQGVPSRELAANVAYMIEDPEGNKIELYRPRQ